MDQETAFQLRVNSFKGLQNLPLYVAMREGYFAMRGLAVALTFTAGSAAQLAGLARGDYHLIQTAPDNVINFETQPEAFGVNPNDAPHVAMILGGSIGPLSVYVRPGITDAQGLYGARLGVDNPTSGFAIVLRDLLQRQGLELERDYSFVVAGSTHARCDALLDGTIAATVLYSPFDLRAADRGAIRLASSTGTYAAYASGSTAGLRPWMDAHGEMVTRYIAAILQALRWLYDPANADATQALMQAEPSLGVAPDLIPAVYRAFVSPATGFGRDAAPDEAGLRQVIALRANFGPPGLRLGHPEHYCDWRWYEAARASLPHDA
ncbi:MAG TPA: ABC transporter substrate-binding protein [Ktedonobacterales bacterium]|nr:ABC transporter substrate-binding protein [Ktedonobacterales bacterium]